MTLASHIHELQKKHSILEKKLDKAKSHPSIDDIDLKHIKQLKLRLKDEISRLKMRVA
jgi:hypothetical protein